MLNRFKINDKDGRKMSVIFVVFLSLNMLKVVATDMGYFTRRKLSRSSVYNTKLLLEMKSCLQVKILNFSREVGPVLCLNNIGVKSWAALFPVIL